MHHSSLVIGIGSAGQRHSETLTLLGSKVTEISRRKTSQEFSQIIGGTANIFEYDLVIISTETGLHQDVLNGVLASGYKGNVLVEKPGMAKISSTFNHEAKNIWVAYNLRYMSALGELKTLLDSGFKPIRVSIIARSFLPSWRPNDNRPDQYSRVDSLGGGALLDLSHEIDYARWLFGDWIELKAVGGKVGKVTQDSDDSWKLIGSTTTCNQISIDLSFTAHFAERECLVEFDDFSLRVNLISGETVRSDGSKSQGTQVLETYGLMLEDSIIGNFSKLPSLLENEGNIRFIARARHEANQELPLSANTGKK